MAKCKDCLHFEACKYMYEAAFVNQLFPFGTCDFGTCDQYKDRSRFVELPCKVGDTVYRIDKGGYYPKYEPFVQELTVTEISWKHEKYGTKDLGFAIIANGIRYKFSSIGKTVFLTREEAETELARRTANG